MRLTLILFGLLFMLLGLLPMLKNFLSMPFIPSEGIFYNAIISGFGILALIIGLAGGIDKMAKPVGLK